MNIVEWRAFLIKESQSIITNYLDARNTNKLGSWQNKELPQEVIDSGWLGYEGALEDEILATEQRLKVALSPSYRNFLKVTNGLKN